MPRTRSFPVISAIILMLVIASLACNAPGLASRTQSPPRNSTDTPDFVIDPTLLTPPDEDDDAPTLTSTDDPAATQTAAAQATGTAGCGYWATFVEDVNVPDGTEFAPGEEFDKTWRLRSTGCQDWPPGTTLVFWADDQMGGPDSTTIQPPGLGNETEITITLTAPDEPGEYHGEWQLVAPDGASVGSYVYVEIVVTEGTEQPTSNGTATATTTGTPTGSPTPDWEPFVGDWENDDPDDARITRVEITEQSGTLHVHMWSSDNGDELDWGDTTTPTSDATDSILNLTWEGSDEESERTEDQQLAILNDGRLLINGQVDYESGGPSDFNYSEYFVRTDS